MQLDTGVTGLLAVQTGARRGEDSSGIPITEIKQTKQNKRTTEVTESLKKRNAGLIFSGFGELSVFSPNSYVKALAPRVMTFGGTPW